MKIEINIFFKSYRAKILYLWVKSILDDRIGSEFVRNSNKFEIFIYEIIIRLFCRVIVL